MHMKFEGYSFHASFMTGQFRIYIDELAADSNKHKPFTQASQPKRTRADIEHELDILRGRIPTPKGYKVDPLRAKQLMAELKALDKT